MLIASPHALSLTYMQTCQTYIVYPFDTDGTVCSKTIKHRNVRIFFQRGSFYIPMDFHTERGGGCLAPRYHSNPDMSAAIKPCAFSFSKTNVDCGGRYTLLSAAYGSSLQTAPCFAARFNKIANSVAEKTLRYRPKGRKTFSMHFCMQN